MKLQPILARMARFPDVLDALLVGVSDDEARWRHADEAWSMVEVVDHLVDEEELDFGPRLRVVLEDPTQDYVPTDPEGIVLQRRGEARDLGDALARFRELRAGSLAWLHTLEGADWEQEKRHPQIGTLSAGDLLASWAAHDALHLRQLAHGLHLLAEHDSGCDGSYGGGW
jgi:hypothetical protein